MGVGLAACTNLNTAQIDKNNTSNNITVNSQELDLHSTEVEKANKVYNEFLNGNISVEDINIEFLTTPKGEPNKHYATKYAFFDSNGDNIPELHINSARYYYILSYINNKLIIWKDLSPYPQFYALKNGAFISHNFGAAPISDEYNYFILDLLGNEVWKVNFSKYDKNENGIYDNDDEYLFDGVNVSKEIWDALTERYLYIDENGIEQIRNEIEWIVIYDETN